MRLSMARVHLAELDVFRRAGVAAVPLARLEQSERLLLAFGVDAPFLGARDDHRRVVGRQLLPRIRASGHGRPHWSPQGESTNQQDVPTERTGRLAPQRGMLTRSMPSEPAAATSAPRPMR